VKGLELVAAAKRGDQDAFAELHRQYVGDVRGVVCKILRTDDPDDLSRKIKQYGIRPWRQEQKR
jgi:hypothetical protein